MNSLVIMKDKQAVTTSLQVAGNFDKRHDSLLRDLDNLKESFKGSPQNWGDLFHEDSYTHPQNKQRYRMIYMTRDGFTLLAMGFTGKKALDFKLKYIQAFNEMESHIKQNQLPIPQSPMEALQLMFDVQKETVEKVGMVDERVTDLEENATLSPGEYGYITRRINQRVTEFARTFGNLTQQQRGELHRDINTGVKQVTGVQTRTQLRQKHFQTVLDFVIDWEPSTATKTIVRQMSLDLKEH